MEMIILLVVIVFYLSYLNHQSRNQEQIRKLSNKIGDLVDEVDMLRDQLKGQEAKTVLPPVQRTESIPTVPSVLSPTQKRETRPEPKLTEEKPLPQEEMAEEILSSPYVHSHRESWLEGWWKRNPDLEKFIGENLVNKIGIAVLVLGVSFFVKYAIDKNWINEVGRVCIGLVCGIGLIGTAHYLRNNYRSFSSVLAGGGLAIFYFTIAFAFHQYALISQTLAFVLMVIITGFAVILSILYNKTELAVIAAIGGFLTPFLVSNGEGNYVVLFTYLVILNAGLLMLSYYKRWPLINIISLFFTELIVAGWMIKTFLQPDARVSYPLVLLFVTLLYLVFLGMNMVYQIRAKKPFKALDFSLLLLLTASYYAAGMVVLSQVDQGVYQGAFTLCSGLVDFSLALFFLRREGSDRNLIYLLIGLTLSFLTLAIPVQLRGHAITLFWSAEFVLLYWLSQRSGIRLFRYSSLLLMNLAVVSLIMDWNNEAAQTHSNLLLIFTGLKGIITNIVAAASFAAYTFLLRKEGPGMLLPEISNRRMIRLTTGASALIVFLTCIFGVNLFFSGLASYEVPNVYHRLITEVFALIIGNWLVQRLNWNKWIQPVSVLLCLLFYLVSFSLITGLRNGFIAGNLPGTHMAFHWLGSVLLLYLLYRTIALIRREPDVFTPYNNSLSWGISVVVVLFLSLELLHIYIIAGVSRTSAAQLEEDYVKAGLTILWALCSFALMWLGMRYKNKVLRIISLSLFTLSLLKLFVFDIQDISEGGKIAAFILLGVLLLTISFMYQRLKNIIINDEI